MNKILFTFGMFASLTIAPIAVPDLSNCLLKTYSLSLYHTSRTKFTTECANSKLLFFIIFLRLNVFSYKKELLNERSIQKLHSVTDC